MAPTTTMEAASLRDGSTPRTICAGSMTLPGSPRWLWLLLDPRNFMDTPFDQAIACDSLNKHLKFDGFEIGARRPDAPHQGHERFRGRVPTSVPCSEDDGRLFIDEQVAKANDKIREGDYDGAITNARSLVEAVLQELERELTGKTSLRRRPSQAYKRVGKQLNLISAQGHRGVAEAGPVGPHQHRWGAIRCEQQDG